MNYRNYKIFEFLVPFIAFTICTATLLLGGGIGDIGHPDNMLALILGLTCGAILIITTIRLFHMTKAANKHKPNVFMLITNILGILYLVLFPPFALFYAFGGIISLPIGMCILIPWLINGLSFTLSALEKNKKTEKIVLLCVFLIFVAFPFSLNILSQLLRFINLAF